MFRKNKRDIYHFFIGGEQFKKEVKRQIRLLIIVTLGFTIAFSWRQTVFDIFQTLVQDLFATISPTASSVLTSTFITVVSLILILIVSYFLQDKYNSY